MHIEIIAHATEASLKFYMESLFHFCNLKDTCVMQINFVLWCGRINLSTKIVAAIALVIYFQYIILLYMSTIFSTLIRILRIIFFFFCIFNACENFFLGGGGLFCGYQISHQVSCSLVAIQGWETLTLPSLKNVVRET